MTTLISTKVGIAKGTPRIWIEGLTLSRGLFTPKARYTVSEKDGQIIIKLDPNGKRKVSSRSIIDLNNRKVGELFPVGTKLRAIVRKGRIVIRRLAIARKALRRDRAILEKLSKNEPLDVVSMFHGGGVMDRALHDGFHLSGVNTRLMLAAELKSKYLNASLNANADLFDDRTVIVNGPVQDFDFERMPAANMLFAGLPCTGMSKAGRSKGKLSSAEDHSEAGALFFTMLNWFKAFHYPAVGVIECTPELLTSPSLSVIRSVLLGWKYDLFELNLNGVEMGCLENRNRAVIIAMSSDLAEAGLFDPSQIVPLREKEDTLADIMEPIGEDDDSWTIHTYLEDKEAEDIKNGKGFRRQLYDGSEAFINTLTGGYARIRSTDPHFKHRTKPRYTRLATPIEHGRIKGLPEGWVESTNAAPSVAHEILGQSVCYPKFQAVGFALGQNLKALSKRLHPNIDTAAPAQNDELIEALAV